MIKAKLLTNNKASNNMCYEYFLLCLESKDMGNEKKTISAILYILNLGKLCFKTIEVKPKPNTWFVYSFGSVKLSNLNIPGENVIRAFNNKKKQRIEYFQAS